MAEFVIKNAKILYGGIDLSGDMNEVAVTHAAEMIDKTVFGSSGRRKIAGLKDFQVTGGGFYNASSTQKNDPHLFSQIGTTGGILTISQNSSLGAICYSAANVLGEYSPGGSVGQMMGFNFACYGDGNGVRAQIVEAGTGLSTALSATPKNLGKCATTQRLYCINQSQALSSSGGTHTIRVRVQADSSSGFGISLTTLIKMSAVDWSTRRISAEMKSTAPGTTDEWFRVRIDSSGSTNSKMTGYIALGIQ